MKIKIRNDYIKIMDIYPRIYIYDDGTKFSHKGFMSHNIDGPSCEFISGGETWYLKDKCHRKYGPARNWKTNEGWCFEGKEYSQEKFMEKFL